ncbi:hypothetical protein [Candidatus Poriferisocius sp.]|uniref:hypothetical protein n=1 Tax=Candidatus Poriferisocius sp. TaxID=3101276 RepID=UPI003B01DA4E
MKINHTPEIGINSGRDWLRHDGRLLCLCHDPDSDGCPDDVGCHLPMAHDRAEELLAAGRL